MSFLVSILYDRYNYNLIVIVAMTENFVFAILQKLFNQKFNISEETENFINNWPNFRKHL